MPRGGGPEPIGPFLRRAALAEANDDGQDAGLVQLLGEEDRSEDEEPRLRRENPGGERRRAEADRPAAEARDNVER